MILSSGLFSARPPRHQKTIDPAQHFAVRVRGKYAMPVTQDHFDGVISEFDAQAATLQKIAALGRQLADRAQENGERCEGARDTLKHAQQMATTINAAFEDFIRPLIFNDHAAHQVVFNTKSALHRAVQEIGVARRRIQKHHALHDAAQQDAASP